MNEFPEPLLQGDQAEGLRRLFAADRARAVPVVANPHGSGYGVPLERLATALAEQGAQVLVVDAADHSPAPRRGVTFDLASSIEPLSSRVAYLAARGLPLVHADAQGHCASFLDLLALARPQAQVLLVHATAPTLVRLFQGQTARPVLLADVEGESVRHAYAGMKLLSQRCGWQQFDLLLSGDPYQRNSARVAQRVADCASTYMGAEQHLWAAVDTEGAVNEPIGTQLNRLAAAQWRPQGPAQVMSLAARAQRNHLGA
jgi:hypothetical protein